ncbi:MAG: lipooligosaccharide sialyltransferase [Butyrivibrio sp.]|nr:lipooligosaccharide sialyltransferase [Butyrivibrio sp.]
MGHNGSRVYICHTFYHVYVTCLKELRIRRQSGQSSQGGTTGTATLILSRMSNDFGTLAQRAEACGLFQAVYPFDEHHFSTFPELAPLKRDTGGFLGNLINRIRFTRAYGRLQAPYLPVDLAAYDEVYVFCDSDPVGYYLQYRRIPYHAVEDGLDCIKYYDTARYDNRGHFRLKALFARWGLIFMQNGWGRYCIDMEVNDIAALPCPEDRNATVPGRKPCFVEAPREALVAELTAADRALLLQLFVENIDELNRQLAEGAGRPRVLILTEPLCDLETRKRLFGDLIRTYGSIDGQEAVVMLKQHPRDLLDYEQVFPGLVVLSGRFPMEMLNFVENLTFDRVISVFTVVDSLHFVREKIFLGDDFMDQYEAPERHRFNEEVEEIKENGT